MMFWEGGAWEDWVGVDGRPVQVQMMTRKLLRGSSRGSWGEELISVLLFLTLSVTLAKIKTLPRKMEIISYQLAKEGIISNAKALH